MLLLHIRLLGFGYKETIIPAADSCSLQLLLSCVRKRRQMAADNKSVAEPKFSSRGQRLKGIVCIQIKFLPGMTENVHKLTNCRFNLQLAHFFAFPEFSLPRFGLVFSDGAAESSIKKPSKWRTAFLFLTGVDSITAYNKQSLSRWGGNKRNCRSDLRRIPVPGHS